MLDITDLGCIGECVGLERLDLSKNDVTKLYALAGLTNLTHLNLSANRISSLGEFTGRAKINPVFMFISSDEFSHINQTLFVHLHQFGQLSRGIASSR